MFPVSKTKRKRKLITMTNLKNKYLMSMGAIEGTQKDKFEFLCKVFKEQKNFWNRNSIPVVDMTSGKIYPSIGLDYQSYDVSCAGYQAVRNCVRFSIIQEEAYEGYKHSYDVDSDNSGAKIYGHFFMDCGSLDTHVLKAMYEGYKKDRETNECLKNMIQDLRNKLAKIKEVIGE